MRDEGEYSENEGSISCIVSWDKGEWNKRRQ